MRAARAVEMIRPRLVIPIHWGTLFPFGLRRLRPHFLTEPPLEFARQVSRLAPDVEVSSRARLHDRAGERMSSAVWIGRVAWAALRGILLLLLIALFFWGLAAVLPGIDVPSFGAVLMITVLVAVLNAVLWPLLIRLLLPLTVLTFGLGSLVLNAAIISLSVKLVDGEAPDFLGAILVAFMLSVGLMLLAPRSASTTTRDSFVSFADERGRSATPTAPTYPA